MGNLCNQQPKNPLAWQRQPDIPFNKDKSPFVGRTPVVIKENIVLSPWDDGCLLLYHWPTKVWSQKPGAQPFTVEWHSVCKSDDEKTIYLYDGESSERLFVIETDNMTKWEAIDVRIHTGSRPLIFQDPTKKKCIHLIGGSSNKKHYIIDIENGTNECVYSFERTLYGSVEDGLSGAAIVHLSSKKISVLIHGAMPLHIWDHNTSSWSNTNIETPEEVGRSFAYVVTKDQRYIVLMGGSGKSAASNAVHILDMLRMEFVKIKGEAPGWCGMEAAITDTGDIHLFYGGTTHHYVINISDMIKNDLWFVDLGPAPTSYVEEEKETENNSKEKEEEASGSAQ